MLLLLVAALASASLASPLAPNDRLDVALVRRDNSTSSASGPILDLGDGGRYLGTVQNDGKVNSWKGIPYAKAPIGNLRFKPPVALGKQNSTVQDVSDDALRCVQFTSPPYTGVKAGPGQEDCLKAWIWAPKSAKKGSKLPIVIYQHGGGLQYSAAANNDFSDWVSQDQGFIAVNIAYRLGLLGFFASTEQAKEGPSNYGLLDFREGIEWVKRNADAFGGDASRITIQGQSGGAFGVGLQLALYNGTKPNFNALIARSIQRSTAFTVPELDGRNAALAQLLNCSTTQSQLACFRNATVPQLQTAYLSITRNASFGSSAGFVPVIDKKTLWGSFSQHYLQGLIANVPAIFGLVNDESAGGTNTSVVDFNARTVGAYTFNETQYQQLAQLYPTNASYFDPGHGGVFFKDANAAVRQTPGLGEQGASCSDRLFAKAMSKKFGSSNVFVSRFNAPTVGTVYSDPTVPLAPAPHSSDNSYLQNATAVMTSYEREVALEWRAYISSFIKAYNPNTYRLKSAPIWTSYGAAGDVENAPMRLVTAFHFNTTSQLANSTTGTAMEVQGRGQRERCDNYWLSPAILAQLKF